MLEDVNIHDADYEEVIDSDNEDTGYTPDDENSEEESYNFENPLDEPDSPKSESFGEVLQLTEYNDSMLTPTDNMYGVIAEYREVKVDQVDQLFQQKAKSFVGKIAKFVMELGDVELTAQHKSYIKDVANLQVANLADMMTLVDTNKQMINNIVRRVNATQAEDYALINSYNQLLNQHMKLLKELQTMYKAIPATIKKMRSDVMLEDNAQSTQEHIDEMAVVTENFGETQFNSGKQLLRKLREEAEKKSAGTVS